MKKARRTLIGVMAIFLGGAMMGSPAWAFCSDEQIDKGCVSTSILQGGCSCGDGKGSEIMEILKLVVDIMTIGVGVLGLVGIGIVGVQYLTAGPNEEQVRKAKRRLFEIVIGLAAYGVAYYFLRWLIPNFNIPF